MAIHESASELAGKTVVITAGEYKGHEYRVEDWWDRIAGKSWGMCDGNPACLEYAFRMGTEGGPTDDEVLYGKIGFFGKLIHVSQIAID